jgi:predicted O-methyltransferase YrrM
LSEFFVKMEMNHPDRPEDNDPEYEALQQQLGLRLGIPYTPNWSAGADFLQIIADACLESKPAWVLECGSGLTTLVLARCCQMNGWGRVVSLENGEEYADVTRSYIKRYGLLDYATVIVAPLRPVVYDGLEYTWYSTDDLPEERIDMLVIDGPPGVTGKHARYPAIPVCYPNLVNNSRIFLDDAVRTDEREIVAMWCERYPGLHHDYRQTMRGCSVLSVDKREK